MNDTMHLFAGAGGGLLADLILGHRPIIAVEWDKYACKVLRERAADGWFPDLSVWEGDVRLFDPSEYAGKVDCIHAGFPCTDISTAGKQAGVGKETRSGLYREVLRIAGIVRPRIIFMENVAAIINNGLGTVLGDLASLGYDAEWMCLQASDCGATHERDRWWLFAHTNNTIKSTIPIDDETQRMQGIGEGNLPNPNITRCKKRKLPIGTQAQHAGDSRNAWWETVPDLPRVANGLADQSHRLKAIGNGQVPLQAALAYSILESLF